MAEVNFEHLKKEITCQKCHKMYSSPKLLPCLHAFCEGCLTLRDGVRDKEGLKYVVDCPQCSETTELPKNGLDVLPGAYFKQRMTRHYSVFSVSKGNKRMECDQCRKPGSQVTTCCSTCGLICDGCLESHRVMKNFSSHTTVPIKGDSIISVLEALKSADDVCLIKCEKHSTESVEKYCNTCKKLICPRCMLEGHKRPAHKIEDISSSAQPKRKELQQSMTQARKARDMLAERATQAQLSKKEFVEQGEKMKKLVTTNIQLLQEQLEKLQTKFLAEIDSTIATHTIKLTDDIDKFSQKAEASEHLVRMGEQALEHTNDIELLSLKRYMNNRLKNLSPKNLPVDSEASAAVDFPTGLSDEIMQIVVAHIKHNISPSLEASKPIGAGIKRAMVDKETSFEVQSLTDVGEPCIEKQVVEVAVTVARTGDKIPVVLTKGSKIGTFVAKYTPKIKGEYQVAIRIEGNLTKRSPYMVVARGMMKAWRPSLMIERQEWPWGVACSINREIFVTRNYHHMVAVFSRDGKYVRKIGLKGQSPGSLWHPTGIAVDSECNLFVADGKENGRLQKFSPNGQLLAIYSKLRQPQGVLLNKEEDRVYVCDKGNRTIVMLDTNLEEKKLFGELDHYSEVDGFESVSGHLVAPHSIAEAENETLFVSDTQSVYIFTKDGIHLREIDRPNFDFAPSGIAIDGDDLYVCDLIKNCLLVFSTSGVFKGIKGSSGKQPGQFNKPTSVYVDRDGYLFVTDYANNRVQVF